MLNLKQIVAQLSENDFEEFSLQLQKSKADKFHTLFSLLRKNSADEDAVMQHLEINSSAFYTLKSRLHDKLQNYFAKHVPETEIDLLKNVANIPTILFNTPRATAIAKLKKMESELVQSDMPYALTSVFN